MMQISNFLRIRPLAFWIILVILFTIPSFTTLLQPGYFGMHDDLQIMRIFEMDKCFKDMQLPCRWIPDMGFGYGYPLFNFYPVMPYYLGELIHFFGFNLIWSVKIDFILSFLVSGVTMFILARKLWGNLGGVLSAVFYVYAPYHAVDVYVRGAMAEAWSLSFAPAVFWAITLVVEKQSRKHILLLAVFSSLFLMSHNPMALVFTPVMAVWALVLILLKKQYKSILFLTVGAFWGLGLAAFFTIPVLLESKLVHIETLFSGYFNYLAHFVSLNQMFKSSFWGFGASVWGTGDGMSFQIGWLHWGAVVLAIPLVAILWKDSRMKSSLLVLLIAAFWFAAFLIHPRSNPIWEKITILQTLQFPWRLLAMTIFTSSLIAGSFLTEKARKPLPVILFMFCLLTIWILYKPYFNIERSVPLTDQQKLSGALWDLQRTAGIFDYLPKTAKFPPGKGAPESPEILEGTTSAKISNFRVTSNTMSFKIESTEEAKIKMPLIDFPQWKIFIDERQIQFDNKNDLGQPTFDVSPGNHKVFARLYNTPIRTLANIISVISFGVLVFFLYKLWKKN